MFGYGNSVSNLKNMAGPAVHVNQHTRRLGRLVLSFEETPYQGPTGLYYWCVTSKISRVSHLVSNSTVPNLRSEINCTLAY